MIPQQQTGHTAQAAPALSSSLGSAKEGLGMRALLQTLQPRKDRTRHCKDTANSTGGLL